MGAPKKGSLKNFSSMGKGGDSFKSTMGDGSLIVPIEVNKIIPTPPGVLWVSRDQKLHVKHRYVGFMLIL